MKPQRLPHKLVANSDLQGQQLKKQQQQQQQQLNAYFMARILGDENMSCKAKST